jgi:hypothetical protein
MTNKAKLMYAEIGTLLMSGAGCWYTGNADVFIGSVAAVLSMGTILALLERR